DDAVKMALDQNVDLKADRLDPQISDTRVAAAYGVFRPTLLTSLNSNNQLQAPQSFLIPTASRDVRHPRQDPAAAGGRPAHIGSACRDDWQRRIAVGRRAVPDQRAGSRAARQDQPPARRAGEEAPG